MMMVILSREGRLVMVSNHAVLRARKRFGLSRESVRRMLRRVIDEGVYEKYDSNRYENTMFIVHGHYKAVSVLDKEGFVRIVTVINEHNTDKDA